MHLYLSKSNGLSQESDNLLLRLIEYWISQYALLCYSIICSIIPTQHNNNQLVCLNLSLKLHRNLTVLLWLFLSNKCSLSSASTGWLYKLVIIMQGDHRLVDTQTGQATKELFEHELLTKQITLRVVTSSYCVTVNLFIQCVLKESTWF